VAIQLSAPTFAVESEYPTVPLETKYWNSKPVMYGLVLALQLPESAGICTPLKVRVTPEIVTLWTIVGSTFSNPLTTQSGDDMAYL